MSAFLTREGKVLLPTQFFPGAAKFAFRRPWAVNQEQKKARKRGLYLTELTSAGF